MRLIEELCELLEAEGIDWVEDGRGGVWWRRYDGTAFVAVEVEGRGLTLKAMYVDPEEAVLMSNARWMIEPVDGADGDAAMKSKSESRTESESSSGPERRAEKSESRGGWRVVEGGAK